MSPLRVLQAVGTLDRGGVETWLLHVLRRVDRRDIEIDFLVHGAASGALTQEAAELGAEVLRIGGHRRPGYGRRLERLLRENRYDILHSHLHFFGGRILRTAARAGVPVRIAHSHSVRSSLASSGRFRRAYTRLMGRWIRRYATHRLACSRPASLALFGEATGNGADPSTLYCGIELDPFAPGPRLDGGALRAELGIPPSTPVIGHVGRFRPVKNHHFILEMASAAASAGLDCSFLLVGDGELEETIRRRARTLGLESRVRFAGARADVPELMNAVIDVLVLPSLHEGLPLVLMEAQAAGVPSVVTNTISDEVDVVPGAIVRLSLQESHQRWVQAALQAARGVSLEHAFDQMKGSPFNVNNSAAALCALYRRAAEPHRPVSRL